MTRFSNNFVYPSFLYFFRPIFLFDDTTKRTISEGHSAKYFYPNGTQKSHSPLSPDGHLQAYAYGGCQNCSIKGLHFNVYIFLAKEFNVVVRNFRVNIPSKSFGK